MKKMVKTTRYVFIHFTFLITDLNNIGTYYISYLIIYKSKSLFIKLVSIKKVGKWMSLCYTVGYK